MAVKPPRWDLSNIYPGLESDELAADFDRLRSDLVQMADVISSQLYQAPPEAMPDELAQRLSQAVDIFNEVLERAGTLSAYLRSFVTTDSYNKLAKRLLSEFEQLTVELDKQEVRFQNYIGGLGAGLDLILEQPGSASQHAFMLREAAEQSRFLMSSAEEDLAAELNLSGANAWSKLQGTVTSQLKIPFELDGEVQELPAPALINLRVHPSETVRRRAYEAELQAWGSIQEPLAAAMNGVKGAVITLNQRRGREDSLHSAIDAARIDRQTLEALLSAMRGSFPQFRKYFQAKARRFGQAQLPWWNLFAPVGETSISYTFPEARDFILTHFYSFAPELGRLANRAFDERWIDAEQRSGKRGGAFCMSLPAVKESRILSNFDGSLDQVFTIAHELGHAFHNDCLYRAGKTELQSIIPMTLAETASILCETLVFEAALAEARNPAEELALLETALISDSQVVVDIYSRFLFEQEVFSRRAEAELSAEDFCEIMSRAQQDTYGDGLDENYRQPYMWTWKPHYYRAELSYYNFPYTFGLLFGTGLYAIYQERGAEFLPEYIDLLASTGEAKADELAARFGIDIRQPGFWESSLSVLQRRIDRYLEL